MKDTHQITTIKALREVIACNDKQKKSLEDRLYNYMDDFAQAFIQQSPVVFFGTANAAGHVDISVKGDAPGFVEVENKTTIFFPERKGNGDARNLSNILENNQVSLLFVIPRQEEVLRITGRASITVDPVLLERMVSCGRAAEVCVKIDVEECFFHCGRAFNRCHIWKPEKWVPEIVRYRFGQLSEKNRVSVDSLVKSTDQILDDLGELDGAY